MSRKIITKKPPLPAGPVADDSNVDKSVVPHKPGMDVVIEEAPEETIEPGEPVENEEPTEPAEPIEPTEPTEPEEKTELAEEKPSEI